MVYTERGGAKPSVKTRWCSHNINNKLVEWEALIGSKRLQGARLIIIILLS